MASPPSRKKMPDHHAILIPSLLLTLSDELLLTIIHNLDRHTDIPSTRLACRKLNDLTETYFYRNVMITLSEELNKDGWNSKIGVMPPQLSKTKQLTILNQRRKPGEYFYHDTICEPHSYRLQRWNLLETLATAANTEFAQASCLAGVRFYPHIGKLEKRQLTAFRWRHAVPLSVTNLTTILDKQARTLQELEISMIQPPTAEATRKFRSALKSKRFPALRVFKYHGLSHTEPLPVNRPERGGRCRMLRPLFQKFHSTLGELLLTQDHCISQVGKTPMTLGRTIEDTLCSLDDLYIDPPRHSTIAMEEQPPITLNLSKLELGGFRVSNLFDLPPGPIAPPRVRLELSSIRRLVLNNCSGLEGLLHKLVARKKDLQQLAEFAVRIEEDDSYPDGLSDVFVALHLFLLSFKGLDVLSVLVEGDASGLRVGKDVLVQHAKTLKAYSVAARNHAEDEDIDNTLRFVSLPTYGIREVDEISPNYLLAPPALREYGTFLNKAVGGEFSRLRHLSQFPELRTVVIRNFPPLTPALTGIRVGDRQFWRDRQGNVNRVTASRMAENFAEQIALPFHALPDSYFRMDRGQDDSPPSPKERTEEDDDDDFDDGFDTAQENTRIRSELENISTKHAAARDRVLGFTLLPHASSPTPKTDPTRDVLKQKARADPAFQNVMHRVETGSASSFEKDSFENYQASVQVALGVRAPPMETMPKLRLLVIGDWNYRDQMNITGPRRWDPTSWSYGSAQKVVDPESPSDEEYSEPLHEYSDTWNYKTYRLRTGFKKEFDVSLLPIFFEVHWNAVCDKIRGRWKWKATVTDLDQTTIEGQGALADTKLLEFAWMT